MRLSRSRPRFTVLRLMVAVAIVGLVLGAGVALWKRSVEFDRIRQIYDNLSDEIMMRYSPEWGTKRLLEYYEPLWRRREYQRMMVQKYRYAASHPWLPVEADPTFEEFNPGPPPRPYPWEPLPPWAHEE